LLVFSQAEKAELKPIELKTRLSLATQEHDRENVEKIGFEIPGLAFIAIIKVPLKAN